MLFYSSWKAEESSQCFSEHSYKFFSCFSEFFFIVQKYLLNPLDFFIYYLCQFGLAILTFTRDKDRNLFSVLISKVQKYYKHKISQKKSIKPKRFLLNSAEWATILPLIQTMYSLQRSLSVNIITCVLLSLTNRRNSSPICISWIFRDLKKHGLFAENFSTQIILKYNSRVRIFYQWKLSRAFFR